MLGRLFVTVLLAVAAGTSGPASVPHGVPSADEQVLKQWKIAPTSAGVLGYLRSQTPDEGSRQAIDRWMAQMGSDRFSERERASRQLVERGVPALPSLRRAQGRSDPEIARRARFAID